MDKSVAAVITTYHRNPEIINMAVESIRLQTYSIKEIIIVNDNEKEAEEYGKVERFCQEQELIHVATDGHRGACYGRNLGIARAESEYIAFLDDDDTWLPEKTEKQMECFNEDVGLVFCKGYLINENFTPAKVDPYFNEEMFMEKVTFKDLLYNDYVGSTSQAIVQKKCFGVVGGFEESLPARQDYEMWIRISKKYEVVGVPQPLFNHYIHKGEQISKNPRKSYAGFCYIYRKYKHLYKEDRRSYLSIWKKICDALKEYNKVKWFCCKLFVALHK